MKQFLALVLVLVFIACNMKLAPVSQTDADRAAQKFPNTTLADLNEGKTIFQSHCKKCHSLKRPFNRTEEEVKAALPRMAKKAKLDKRQEELVLKYLLTAKETYKKG